MFATRQRHLTCACRPIAIISASLSISIASGALMLRTFAWPICRSAHVSSGNMADWIRMPFGVVSGVGLGMGVLDFCGDRRREEAVGGEFAASHCY